MFVRRIAKGSNYRIRSLWINACTYNLSLIPFFWEGGGHREREEWVFMGKEGASFEVVH